MEVKNIITGAVFGAGAFMMCAVAKTVSLTWAEVAFILGLIMVVASGMCIVRKGVKDGTEEITEMQG